MICGIICLYKNTNSDSFALMCYTERYTCTDVSINCKVNALRK